MKEKWFRCNVKGQTAKENRGAIATKGKSGMELRQDTHMIYCDEGRREDDVFLARLVGVSL